MYIFVTLISAFLLGIYEVLKKVSLRKSNVYEVLFFYCLSGFVISLVFIKDAMSINLIDLMFVFLKSVIIVINWLLVLKAMEKLDVGIVAPFSLLTTVLVVFASHFIFNEQLTWLHFASLLFIGSGIILLTMLEKKQDNSEKKENNYLYLIYLIIGNLLGVATALIDKYLLNIREMKSTSFLFWFMLFISVMYGIIYLFKNKRIEWKKLKTNYWMIFTGASIALADITYYYAISMDNAQLSIISILRKTSVVVATILASIFLKEKHLIKKLLILLIMLMGVVLPIIFQ
jgi:transporter family protein